MMKRFLSALVFLVIAVTAGIARAETVTIKFGDLGANTANLYQYLGIEKGIYERHGIDLQLISFRTGGPSVIPAASSGQVDLGGIGTPILTGISRGIPIKVVGAPPLRGQEFVLVGRPDIKSFEDLRGKNVGVSSVGGGQDQALKVILKAKGLNQADIKVIAVGNASNGYVAFKSGQLAGTFVSEPVLSKIELEGSGHVLERAADYYGRYQHSYIFATNTFIKDHPEALRRFFAANREAIHYAKAHRDELLAFGRKKLGLEEALLTKIFNESIPEWDESQTLDVEGMLNAIKILKEVGDINKSYVPVVDQIADLRFID